MNLRTLTGKQRRALHTLLSGSPIPDDRTATSLLNRGLITETLSGGFTLTPATHERLTRKRRKQPYQPSSTIHPVLKELLNVIDEQDLSQRAVAQRAGYAESTLSHWRSGKQSTHLHVVSDFAEALGFELTLRPIDRPDEGVPTQAGDRTAGGDRARGLHSSANLSARDGTRLSPSRD